MRTTYQMIAEARPVITDKIENAPLWHRNIMRGYIKKLLKEFDADNVAQLKPSDFDLFIEKLKQL